MCQFHWELDCVGFCPFEIWRCDCVEMMRGIGGEGFFFSILGYRRGIAQSIAGNTRVVLPCLVAAAGAATATTAAGSAGPAAAVAASYLPTTELRAPQGAHAAVVTGRAVGVATALRA